MNVHDSEQMATLLKDLAWGETRDPHRADLIVVNTCSIREKAAQKVLSQLGRFGRFKQDRPNLVLAVGGCLAQQWGKGFFKKAPCVDIVFGTHNIHRLGELVKAVETTGRPAIETEFHRTTQSLGILATPRKNQLSAFVTIMQGCNNYCAFCVVPYVRGREESRPWGEIVAEIEMLARHGVREVTLLGQNVNSYGAGKGDFPDFAELLKKIGRIDGIERIRFTTSHPKDLSDDLIRCFAEVPALCEHIHLPVQSGSDRILAGMNRGYTKGTYLEKVRRLRAACPEISITSDMIVGFPGETESDFQDTLALMEEVRFDNLFSFKYSKREGTDAAGYGDQVSEKVKRERLMQLQSLQGEHTLERNAARVGRELTVLVEGCSRRSDHDLMGRTRDNRIVNFTGDEEMVGRSVDVLITAAYQHSLRGCIPATPR